jgi:hypothetical protein
MKPSEISQDDRQIVYSMIILQESVLKPGVPGLWNSKNKIIKSDKEGKIKRFT